MTVSVQREDFDPAAEQAAMLGDRVDVGGVVSFIGLVRDFSDGRGVGALTLEHYPGMTERELEKIESEARARWELQESLIIHRYGDMALGEPIVLVVTASPHRQDAFEAAHFLMDWLKTKAPFWKQEMNASGETNWVKERKSDLDAANRWKSES